MKLQLISIDLDLKISVLYAYYMSGISCKAFCFKFAESTHITKHKVCFIQNYNVNTLCMYDC